VSIALQRCLWLVLYAAVLLIVFVGASALAGSRWLDAVVLAGLLGFSGWWFRFGVRRGLVEASWWPSLGDERARRAALTQERNDTLAEARKKLT
jgi:hypothetical protein